MQVVTNNILSQFTSRQLKIATGQKAKSAEKLSTGYRINRSADDAAGLQISEKMRWQIKGLDRASDNCQEAVSFCQVTDGAMNEIHDMTGRLKELSVQAANDTNTEIDRAAIQNEIDQICTEIQRIAENTKFNDIKVFGKQREKVVMDGTPGAAGTNITSQEVYEVSGNNYGLAEVIGVNNLSPSNKLNEVMEYDTTNTWTTTGDQVILDGTSMTREIFLSQLTGYDSGLSFDLQTLKNNLGSDSRLTSISANSYIFDNAPNGPEIRLEYSGGNLRSGYIKEYTVDQITGEKTYISNKAFENHMESIGDAGVAGNKYGSAWIDFSGVNIDYKLEDLYGEGFNTSCATCSRKYSIKFTDSGDSITTNGTSYTYVDTNSMYPRLEVNISGCTNGQDIVDRIIDAVENCRLFENHYTQYAFNDDELGKLYIYDNRVSCINGGRSTFEPTYRREDGSMGISGEKTVTNPTNGEVTVYSDREMWIQAGAKEQEGMWLNRAWINNSILGVGGLSVLDFESAQASLASCETALRTLSEERSRIGALQNRFTYASLIDDNTAENTQAAESRIRDADMAEEMLEYSKHNILEQAGLSVLAQANQNPQGILTLLQ